VSGEMTLCRFDYEHDYEHEHERHCVMDGHFPRSGKADGGDRCRAK
jgi:hypothetical protein